MRAQEYAADVNIDGHVDGRDLAVLVSAWLSRFGRDRWAGRSDLADPELMSIDFRDFTIMARDWMKTEQWRTDAHEL
jgi:hypothetical protein